MIQNVTTNFDIPQLLEKYEIINKNIMQKIYPPSKREKFYIEKDANLKDKLSDKYKELLNENQKLVELLKNKIENNISPNIDDISDR